MFENIEKPCMSALLRKANTFESQHFHLDKLKACLCSELSCVCRSDGRNIPFLQDLFKNILNKIMPNRCMRAFIPHIKLCFSPIFLMTHTIPAPCINQTSIYSVHSGKNNLLNAFLLKQVAKQVSSVAFISMRSYKPQI